MRTETVLPSGVGLRSRGATPSAVFAIIKGAFLLPPPLPTAILFAIHTPCARRFLAVLASACRPRITTLFPRTVSRKIGKHFAQGQHEEDQGLLGRGRLRGGRSGLSGGRGRLRGGMDPGGRDRGESTFRALLFFSSFTLYPSRPPRPRTIVSPDAR